MAKNSKVRAGGAVDPADARTIAENADDGGGTVLMRWPTEKEEQTSGGVAVEGVVYPKRSDGKYHVARRHLPVLLQHGLVQHLED